MKSKLFRLKHLKIKIYLIFVCMKDTYKKKNDKVNCKKKNHNKITDEES